MLGLEQNPSPHELRQIAAKRHMTQHKQHKNVHCLVQDKITVQCSLYGCRICLDHAWEKPHCLSACLLQILNFKSKFIWCNLSHDQNLILNSPVLFQNSNRPQSEYGQMFPLTFIMVKLQKPAWQQSRAIFFFELCCHKCVPVCVFSWFWLLFTQLFSFPQTVVGRSPAPSSHQVESSHWPLFPEPHC